MMLLEDLLKISCELLNHQATFWAKDICVKSKCETAQACKVLMGTASLIVNWDVNNESQYKEEWN